VRHCCPAVPAMIDLRARALGDAAACDAASVRANSIDRLTFQMMGELWRTLVKHINLTDSQAITDFGNLLEIQQDVAKYLRPPLH
jgi:hypothetical protein